jgi:hypothetical protein
MPSFGMLRRVALVKTDILEERIAFMNRAERIGELETRVAVTRNRSTSQRADDIGFYDSCFQQHLIM